MIRKKKKQEVIEIEVQGRIFGTLGDGYSNTININVIVTMLLTTRKHLLQFTRVKDRDQNSREHFPIHEVGHPSFSDEL